MPAAWCILANPPLPGTPLATIAYAALHPARGIALLDPRPERKPGDAGPPPPPPNPDAVARVRAGLNGSNAFGGVKGVRFDAIYPGHLPIIYRQISASDLVTLAADLDAAFATEPPISLTAPPGADPATWVGLARRVLGADLAPPVPTPAPRATSVPAMQPYAVSVPRQPAAVPVASRRAVRAMQASGVVVAITLGVGLYANRPGVTSSALVPAPTPVAAAVEPPEPAPVAQADLTPAPTPPEPAPEPLPEPVETAQAPVQPELPATHDEAPLAPEPSKPLPEMSAPVVEAPADVSPKPASAPPAVSNAALIRCGNERLEQHDIMAARHCFERAANAGDGMAARLMGRTYDPEYLTPDERGFADLVVAQIWYTKAGQLGLPTTGFEQRFRAAVQRAR